MELNSRSDLHNLYSVLLVEGLGVGIGVSCVKALNDQS